MIGPISAAALLIAFTLLIVEENHWARKCRALYLVKFDEAPIKSPDESVRLEDIAMELNLDANGSGTKYWVHGRSLFSNNGFSLRLGEALRFRDLKREHAFI